MARISIAEKNLSNAEKQRHYWERKNSPERKLKDKLQKQTQHENLYKTPEKHKEYLKKKDMTQRKWRNALKQTNITNNTNTIKFNFHSLSRSIRKAKRSLPKNNEQKRFVIKPPFHETISCSPRKMRLISTWTDIQNISRKKGRLSMLKDKILKKTWYLFIR